MKVYHTKRIENLRKGLYIEFYIVETLDRKRNYEWRTFPRTCGWPWRCYEMKK
jgi:hypothetical protein